jgi:hypothetical protein
MEWLRDETQMTQPYVFFLRSEEITSTYFGYELQLSKLYTRWVYNKFKETYKSSTTFFYP